MVLPHYTITTKLGLYNSQRTIDPDGFKPFSVEGGKSNVLNNVRNLHYRGVRQPGLVTHAGAAPQTCVLPRAQ